MFGLGKLLGGALDAIGLGGIAPYMSLALNAMSGNFAGLAIDIVGLMSNMKGLGFLKKVAQFAPLGGFGGTGQFGGSFGNYLSSGRLSDLASKFSGLTSGFKTATEGVIKIEKAFKLAQDVLDNKMLLEQARRGAEMSALVGANR